MGVAVTRSPVPRTDVALRPAAMAMAWIGEGQPHEVIAVPGVALADGDVLVAVELSTICDSDVHTVSGRGHVPAPLVLGHESVGRVIAMGEGVVHTVDGSTLRIGDRVVWSVTVSCASCDRCLHGMPQKCRAVSTYGQERIGVHGDLTGAFGSHMQLRRGTAIVRVPETLPAAVLAPASCATASAWAAVSRAARDKDLQGAAVRVYGAGLVGLSAAAIAVEHGATVEMVDANPQRRALAARFGAEGIDRHPDVVIETSGHAVHDAFTQVDTGGIVVLAGSAIPTPPVLFDAEDIARRLVTVAGVHHCTGVELSEAVSFLAGRGRAYPFADAVGEVHALGDLDAALLAASAPDAPPRIGLVPGR